MNIWLLVIILLVIAIILLIASFFVNGQEDDELEEQFESFSVQQSQELLAIKNRLNELESEQAGTTSGRDVESFDGNLDSADYYEVRQAQAFPVEDDEVELESITDDIHNEIISLYSQGYTMVEISQAVNVNLATVQHVIDEYIENR